MNPSLLPMRMHARTRKPLRPNPNFILILNQLTSAAAAGLLRRSETYFSDPPPALLHSFLRLHPHLPNAGYFGRRRLGVVEPAASFLAGDGEEGGGLSATDATAIAETAADEGERGGAAFPGGAYRFGESHGEVNCCSAAGSSGCRVQIGVFRYIFLYCGMYFYCSRLTPWMIDRLCSKK